MAKENTNLKSKHALPVGFKSHEQFKEKIIITY